MTSSPTITVDAELPALAAGTLCAAFQTTAAVATGPGGVADARRFGLDHVGRVCASGAADRGGLAALGVGRGDTVAIMLVNRPEFHLVDTAVMHLGAIPFSIYNTSSPEQIAALFANAGNRVVVTERAFVPVIERALGESAPGHVIVVDPEPADRRRSISLDQLEAMGDNDFDFAAAWARCSPAIPRCWCTPPAPPARRRVSSSPTRI